MASCSREHELGRSETEDTEEVLAVRCARVSTELVDVLDQVVAREQPVEMGLVRRRARLRGRLELRLLGQH